MYQRFSGECQNVRTSYILAYRAIRKYHNGRISIAPLTLLRSLQEVLPFFVPSDTERAFGLASQSFNVRHQAPKGVHEPQQYCKATNLIHPFFKRVCGQSTLRTQRYEINLTQAVHILQLQKHSRKAVRIISPLERMEMNASLVIKRSELALAA